MQIDSNIGSVAVSAPLDPSPADLADPLFDVVWKVIKRWDVNAPWYTGYCGASGTHVMALLQPLREATSGSLQQKRDACLQALREIYCRCGGTGSQSAIITAMEMINGVFDASPDMAQRAETHEAYSGNLRYEMKDWTPAELAIHEAMRAVEEAGGSPHLTIATRLLSQARQAVARHVLS